MTEGRGRKKSRVEGFALIRGMKFQSGQTNRTRCNIRRIGREVDIMQAAYRPSHERIGLGQQEICMYVLALGQTCDGIDQSRTTYPCIVGLLCLGGVVCGQSRCRWAMKLCG